MKREVIAGFFLSIFLIGMISAGWVSLDSDDDYFLYHTSQFTSNTNLPETFRCSVHELIDSGNIVYFYADFHGSWIAERQKSETCSLITPNPDKQYCFVINKNSLPPFPDVSLQGVPTGVYHWTCAYRDLFSQNYIFAQKNKTIIFTRENDAIIGSGKFQIEYIFQNPQNLNPTIIQQNQNVEIEIELQKSFYFVIDKDLKENAPSGTKYGITESPHLSVKIKDSSWGKKLINITPDSNFVGSTYIIFNATAPTGLFTSLKGDSLKWIIIINGTSTIPEDQAPTFTPFQIPSWPKNTNKTFGLSTYFLDPNGDSLIYSATTPTHFSIQISGSQITFIPENNFVGSGYTSITAKDPAQNSVTASNILLNVTNSNSPPTMTFSPTSTSVSLEVGESKLFSVTATDPENATLIYAWILDGTKVGNLTTYTYPSQTIPKNQTLKINVSDQYYSLSRTWNIGVIPDEGLPNENDTIICEPVCACASNTCIGRMCTDTECGTSCQGTKDCSSTTIEECSANKDCENNEECINRQCEKKAQSKTEAVSYLIWIAVGILVILIGVGIFFLFKTLKKNKQLAPPIRSSSGPVYPR